MPKGVPKSGVNKGWVKNGDKRGPRTEEWKKMMSEKMTGRKASDETRRKLSESHKGKPRPHLVGKKRSPETIAKMRAANLGKKYPPRSEQARENMRKAWPKMKENGFKLPVHNKPHTQEAKDKMTKAKLGKYRRENSWNWKGGKTSEQKLIRESKEYKQWRQSVYERDGFKCVLCGIRGGWNKEQKRDIQINADHIKPFSLYPEFRLDLDNGRTLCLDCHKETDSYCGKIRKII